MDIFTKEKRSWVMSRIKSKDTKPELSIRKHLFRDGYRYRKNYKIIGRPDIAFPKKKIAIFVDGCFWHKHKCKDFVMPKTNTLFWKRKLGLNAARDRANRLRLKKSGWKIITIWECELKSDYLAAYRRITKTLGKYRLEPN